MADVREEELKAGTTKDSKGTKSREGEDFGTTNLSNNTNEDKGDEDNCVQEIAMTNPRLLCDPNRPKPAPLEYAGQWVAWDHERTRIVAHGASLQDVCNATAAAGVVDPVYERVRRVDEHLVGRV